MAEPAEDIEPYLSTTAEMLAAEGMASSVEILRSADYRVEETGHDNWNGGTYIWTVFLAIEPAHYGQLGDSREPIEEQITVRLKAVVAPYTSNWYTVSIVPKVLRRPDWREPRATCPKRRGATSLMA